jgi:hypothetical protein
MKPTDLITFRSQQEREQIDNARRVEQLIQHGYDVTRWHTMPNIRPQNLAAHQWSVAMLVMSLFKGHPDDKLLLIQAALEHDLAEAFIGDMPRPGRTEEHKALEERVSSENGIFHDSLLPKELRRWLAAADLIEAGMHAHREYGLGNTRYDVVMSRVNVYIRESNERGEIPPELWTFAKVAGLSS